MTDVAAATADTCCAWGRPGEPCQEHRRDLAGDHGPPKPPPPDDDQAPPAPPRRGPGRLPPPHEPPTSTQEDGVARGPSTWQPVDLTDALAGVEPDAPTLLERTDGLRLLYPGRIHWLAGESESCKSWIAQHAAAVELQAGRDVLYVDYESDDRDVVSRLQALGVDRDAIAAHLVYIRPDEPLTDRYGVETFAATDLAAALDARAYTLAVVDGVTEALTIEGVEIIDNGGIARWMRLLPKRLAAAGPAVACIDHLPKIDGGNGRYAIGAQHKLAGIDGCAYRIAVRRPLGRATGSEPVEASVTVTLSKDRPGWVRGRTVDGQVGVVHLTAYPDGGLTLRLDPPGATGPDHLLVRAVLEHLDAYDGSSGRQVTEAIDGKTDRIRDALRWMVDNGWLRVELKGRSHLHWLTDVGREQLDQPGEDPSMETPV